MSVRGSSRMHCAVGYNENVMRYPIQSNKVRHAWPQVQASVADGYTRWVRVFRVVGIIDPFNRGYLGISRALISNINRGYLGIRQLGNSPRIRTSTPQLLRLCLRRRPRRLALAPSYASSTLLASCYACRLVIATADPIILVLAGALQTHARFAAHLPAATARMNITTHRLQGCRHRCMLLLHLLLPRLGLLLLVER